MGEVCAFLASQKLKFHSKILIVIIALLLLPVMFILMLPSLIFGNEGLDAVPDNV